MGLSKEETSKAWDDIQFHWNVIKKIEKGDPEKSRKEINKIQTLLGVEVTDFSKETPLPLFSIHQQFSFAFPGVIF